MTDMEKPGQTIYGGNPYDPITPAEDVKIEKLKKYFGNCFEMPLIEEDDLIPVGGGSMASDVMDIKITADFENLKDFFEGTHALFEKYNLAEMKEYLDKIKVEIDEKLFATLFAFTKKYDAVYPYDHESKEKRPEIYLEKGENIRLSDIFDANAAKCAEIAAIAQAYLQRENVSSSYFSGDVLANKTAEFSSKHSFIILRLPDKTYIYDPAIPTKTDQGNFPSIYSTKKDFDEAIATMGQIFVTAKNLFSKTEVYYGTNNMTSVFAEESII